MAHGLGILSSLPLIQMLLNLQICVYDYICNTKLILDKRVLYPLCCMISCVAPLVTTNLILALLPAFMHECKYHRNDCFYCSFIHSFMYIGSLYYTNKICFVIAEHVFVLILPLIPMSVQI